MDQCKKKESQWVAFFGFVFIIMLATASALAAYEQPQPAQEESTDDLQTGVMQSEEEVKDIKNEEPLLVLEEGLPVAQGKSGEWLMVHLPLVMKKADRGTVIRGIIVRPILPDNRSQWPFDERFGEERKLSELVSGARVEALYEWKISKQAIEGIYDIQFEVNYTLERQNGQEILSSTEKKSQITLQVEIKNGDEKKGNLLIEQKKESGEAAPVRPTAKAGEKMRILLHLKNEGESCSDVVIAPDISSDLDDFPFHVQASDTVQELDFFEQGSETDLVFDFVVHPNVTKGIKYVSFTVVYRVQGKAKERKFRVPVEISDGAMPTPAPPESGHSHKEADISIQDYSIVPSKPLAGDEFSIKINVLNKGEDPAYNLQMNFSCLQGNDDGRIDVIESGSDNQNIPFCDKLEVGEEKLAEWKLRFSEEAANTTCALNIELEYEDKNGKKIKTSQIITVDVIRAVAVEMRASAARREAYHVGEVADVEIEVENTGGKTVNSVSLQIDEGNDETSTPAEYGILKSGEKATLTLPVKASGVGENFVQVVLQYADENGETYQESREICLVANQQREEMEEIEFDENGLIIIRDEEGKLIGKQDPTTGDWVDDTIPVQRYQTMIAIIIGVLLVGVSVGTVVFVRKQSQNGKSI